MPTPFAARWLDALAIGVLIIVAAIAFATFTDYGLGWDDFTHSQYGALLVDLYRSGFTDQRALSFVNLYMYGGGFDTIATIAAKILPLGVFETRRLVGVIIGLIGLFLTWRSGRRLGGPFAGLATLILLAACPLYYGHMFMNAKDAPFATVMMIALLGIVRAFEEYPRPTAPTLALCGIGIGLAIGSRVLGGFAVVDAVLTLIFLIFVRSRANGLKLAFAECGTFIVPFVPAAVLAYLVMGLVWPWSVVSPLNPIHAVDYFSSFFDKPWRELFDGRLILVPDMPRSYAPTLEALKNTELMLALGLSGAAGIMIAVARSDGEGDCGDTLGNRRAALLVMLLATFVPLLVTVATRPYMYNGVRHLLFTLPPFAILGGLAAAWIAQGVLRFGKTAIAAAALIFAAGIASPVVEMVRLHPYQYTYFNHLIGGVAGARPYFMIDYWGLSMTQASRELSKLLYDRGEKPSKDIWTVAVCGPHPNVAVNLGPKFEAIWDPKGADFAMMLEEFYCADLDAPVVLEIKREGIVYARVYDIRGRNFTTLLRYPNANNE
ncbi:MAG TPA: glycosyltransferase family 39 protein [Xanthobacteraceae bacterium]|nr:glycosyltransferase family 39 protein [Xanthobacteraceae bacterium]